MYTHTLLTEHFTFFLCYVHIWKNFSSKVFTQFSYFYSQIDRKSWNPQKSCSVLPARKICSIHWQWSNPLPVGNHCTKHKHFLFACRDCFHNRSPQTSITSSYPQTTVSAPPALSSSQLRIHLCSPLLTSGQRPLSGEKKRRKKRKEETKKEGRKKVKSPK